MENKYYTPSIEDLHVGYECEWNTHADPTQIDQFTTWTHHVFTVESLENYGIECMKKNMKHFRTPYLTKEQIEAEGWKIKTYDIHKAFDFVFKKENYFGIRLKTGKLDIHMADVIKDEYLERTSHSRLYYGECKSINELRIICKLLNIK